ncbi:MAG: carbohydrate ABC transporter permease [Stackebrandtia sp.]
MFYPLMLPLFAATALIGALVGRSYWRSAGMTGLTGVIAGAAAGALGPLLTMVPMRSCTFEPGRTAADMAIGGVAFAVGAAVAVGLTLWIGRALSQPGGLSRLDTEDRAGVFQTRGGVPLLLLLPTLVILAVFLYWPLAETLRMSTHKLRRGAPREPFVCVDNYTELLGPSLEWWAAAPVSALLVVAVAAFVAGRGEQPSSITLSGPASVLRRLRGALAAISVVAVVASMFGPEYRPVFVNTMILTAGTTLLALAAGLAIALLVSQPIRGRAVYRTMLIWPYAISPPIAGILFFVIFDPISGVAGHAWEAITPWEFPNFRGDPVLARVLVIVASVWKVLGFTILFYIAGLQNVSKEMLEAASLDGAGAWTRFRQFTLPSLAPITFFLVITTVTYAFFHVFGTIDYLTEGGPSGATTDAMTSIVQTAHVHGSFGDGAAHSMVLFAMILAVTAWQFRSTGRRITYGR